MACSEAPQVPELRQQYPRYTTRSGKEIVVKAEA